MCIVSIEHEKGEEIVLPPELLNKVYERIIERIKAEMETSLIEQKLKGISVSFNLDKNGNLIRSGKNEK